MRALRHAASQENGPDGPLRTSWAPAIRPLRSAPTPGTTSSALPPGSSPAVGHGQPRLQSAEFLQRPIEAPLHGTLDQAELAQR